MKDEHRCSPLMTISVLVICDELVAYSSLSGYMSLPDE